MTLKLMLGEKVGGNYDSVQSFKMVDGLLDQTQGGDKADWWLQTPMPRYRDRACWFELRIGYLVGADRRGTAPDVLEIGVKLGNSAFGLIHFLAGHAEAVRHTGPNTVLSTGDQRTDVYRTLLALQAGLDRFKHDAIRQVNYDQAKDKFTIAGSHSSFIVLTRSAPGDKYGITTIYNTQRAADGTQIYP
jgi:hypothetical protein